MAYLTQYSSSVPVIKFNIDQSVMTIGQNFDMDICVPEDGISENHATIEATKQAESFCFIIKSNENESLLELNGAAISHAELKNNDWINIGGVEFQFTDDGVNEIKETTKTAAAPLRSVKPAMVKQLVQPLETVKEKPVVQSNNDKTMTTKEYVAKSRYSRRRLAF